MSDVTERIQSFAGKVSIGALGGGGLIFTIVTCYSLYSYVERIFNDIWRVGQRRTLIGKFLTFYAMVTLLPTLAGFSLYWSGRLIGSDGMTRFFAPFMIELLGLVMMNKLLPRTNVDWSAAAAGALATAWLLEATKYLFVRFAERIMLKSYNSVYGPLGLVPLVLVWIYAAWVLVLLGRGDHARAAEPAAARGGGPAAARRRADQRPGRRADPGGGRGDARGGRRGAPQGAAGDRVRADAAQRRADRGAAQGARPHRRGARRSQRLRPGARGVGDPRSTRCWPTFRSTDVEIATTAPPRPRCGIWSSSSTRSAGGASPG